MFNVFFALVATFTFAILTLKTSKAITTTSEGEKPQYGGLISIIIPARNEAKRIEKLLKSLTQNDAGNVEIIVVNDMSDDDTETIAKNYGKVINISEIKDNFRGKTNACEVGFQNSNGEVLVFIDADTFVTKNFLPFLRSHFAEKNDVLTIQPKHRTKKIFEQLSMFFHVSSITSTGVMSLARFGFGLYGPCIAMKKDSYVKTEGFANEKVRSSIIEDVALSKVCKDQDISVERYLGEGLIEYRMYNSLQDLFRGWKRNIAAGFSESPKLPAIILVLFYGSLISNTISVISSANIVTYVIFVVQILLLLNAALKLGNYLLGVILFPIVLLFFFGVFFVSVITRIFNLDSSWAGRKLKATSK